MTIGLRTNKPYGKLEYRDGRWVMSGIEPHVSIRLKANFEHIHKGTSGEFTFPDSENIAADLEWFLQRYPMEMAAGDRKRLVEGRQLFELGRDEIERILMPDWQPPARFGFRHPFKLWLRQEQAVEVWQRKKRLLLGDPVGEGKTFSALGGLVGSNHLPAAILAKTHLPNQWVNEYIKPHTYLSAHVIKQVKPYRLPPANLYIFKYSNIHGWVDVAAQGIFKAFVADEVHELRTGRSTAKGKAAAVFAEMAEMTLGMSATPIFNYGNEIWNILDILMPGVLGTWDDFAIAWCTYDGRHWLVKDPDALGTYLRELQVFLRRTRDGRPVNTQVIEVDYDFSAERKSRDLAKALAIKTTQGTFTESGRAARELDAMMRHDTGVGKARGVAGFVRMLVSQGVKVILGGWHRDVYRIWLDELSDLKPALYTGSETSRQKDKVKAGFIEGDVNPLIMSLRSGDGVDGFQTVCHTVVFGEYDWSPEVHHQLIGRVDRTGQTEPVIDAFYCHTENGSDPTIIDLHGVKASQASGIVDPLKGVEVVHRDTARVKRLAENYLAQIGAAQ